jgi:NAD(P)-dependent dehydrogenase (short-subunit alcohol dehydrogenase family)
VIAFIGATSGLGRAAAAQLAQDGHKLVLIGRDPKRIERLARQIPGGVVIGADVSTAAGVDHAATQIESAVDHPDGPPLRSTHIALRGRLRPGGCSQVKRWVPVFVLTG